MHRFDGSSLVGVLERAVIGVALVWSRPFRNAVLTDHSKVWDPANDRKKAMAADRYAFAQFVGGTAGALVAVMAVGTLLLDQALMSRDSALRNAVWTVAWIVASAPATVFVIDCIAHRVSAAVGRGARTNGGTLLVLLSLIAAFLAIF